MIISHATWSPPKPFHAILNAVPKSLIIVAYSKLIYSVHLLLKSPFLSLSTLRYQAEYYCRIHSIKWSVLKNVQKMWAHCAWQWGALRNLMRAKWGTCDVRDELMREHQNKHTHTHTTLTHTSLLYVHRVSSSRSLGILLNTQMLCLNKSSTKLIEFAKFLF